jgi:hypothetical protein
MFRLLLLLTGLSCHAAFAQTWNCTDVLDWNFFGAEVTQNNLGGVGPNLQDNRELRYSGVISKGNLHGDLVVTAGQGYIVHNSTKNGLNGEFGQINVRGSSYAQFTFSFIEAGSTDKPFPIEATEKLQFSVYDLDAGNAREHEFAQFVTGVASHRVTETTTVAVSGNDSDGTLYAASTRLGTEGDNPSNPLTMTALAEDSKISVTYVGKSSWQIVLGDKAGPTKRGRNILFAGRSQGDCACIGVSNWTLHNNLEHNNLGGMGPVTTDPPELRYSKVFKTGRGQQQEIDLLVKVAHGSAYAPANTSLNGLWPKLPDGRPDHTQMGQLNIGCGTETTFDFMFVESGTNKTYNLSNVMFSVYDLDQHKGYVNHEFVVFPEPVTNWTLTEDPPTQVNQTGLNDGTLRFTSTEVGNLDDNPTDPKKLTPLQRSRSVTVWYSGSATFKVTFGHDYTTPGGRNILFAGPGIYCT